MFFLETILIQQRTSYPDDMQLNAMTDGDLGTCVDLPAVPHKHRMKVFLTKPSTDFDIQVHTNDSSLCRRAHLYIPLSIPSASCNEPLEFEGCPLKTNSMNVCTYRCKIANMVTIGGTFGEPDCATLYFRTRRMETGLQVCEVSILP